MGCEGAAGRDESSLPIVVIDLDRRRVTVAATENRRPLCIGKADGGKQTFRVVPDCATRLIPHHVNRIKTKRPIVSMVT